jgi:hypothetical protein
MTREVVFRCDACSVEMRGDLSGGYIEITHSKNFNKYLKKNYASNRIPRLHLCNNCMKSLIENFGLVKDKILK